MKTTITITITAMIVALIASQNSLAQGLWQSGSYNGNKVVFTKRLVGVHTKQPNAPLEVEGQILGDSLHIFGVARFGNTIAINSPQDDALGSTIGEIYLLKDAADFNNIRIGIGTDSPDYTLQLEGDGTNTNGSILSVGSVLGVGANLTGANLGGGSRPRFIWYAKKAAIRAGQAPVGFVNDANIGDFSVAFGERTRATGIHSASIGNSSDAFGDNSFTFGQFLIVDALAPGAMVFGSGLGVGNEIINSTPNSLMVGFNSDVPTFFVGGGDGTSGSLGNVGIGTGLSLPTNRLEINSGTPGESGLTFTQLTNTTLPIPNPDIENGVLSVDATGKVILVEDQIGVGVGLPAPPPGSIQFNDASAFGGNPNFVWDIVNERLGIGTISPGTKLDVAGGSINTDTDYRIGGLRVLSIQQSTNSIFVGDSAGHVNTGHFNTFVGQAAGSSNTFGFFNTFIGQAAGSLKSSGFFNTFVGAQAGKFSYSGNNNSFFGSCSGQNSLGTSNSFFGGNCGKNNAGNNNSFYGLGSGSNSSGSYNSFFGFSTGNNNTGNNNTYLGYNADGSDGINNATAIGANATVTASNSLILGNNANVGIGVTAPSEKLHINGKVRIEVLTGGTDNVLVTADNTGVLNSIEFPDDIDQVLLGNGDFGTPPPDADADPTNELITSANLVGNILEIIEDGNTFNIDLTSLAMADDDWAVSVNDVFTGISGFGVPTGNVGIGTSNPTGKLHIVSSLAIKLEATPGVHSDIRFIDDSSPGYQKVNWLIRGHAGSVKGRDLEFLSRGGGDFIIGGPGAGPNVGINIGNPAQTLHVGGNTAITGNLGIGITAPTERLHVVGKAIITDLTGGTDNVLVTADDNGVLNSIEFPDDINKVLLGNGTFDLPPAVIDDDWTGAGTGNMFNINDNVGVGYNPAGNYTKFLVVNNSERHAGRFISNFSPEWYNIGIEGVARDPGSEKTNRGVAGLATGWDTNMGIYGRAEYGSINFGVYAIAVSNIGSTNFGIFAKATGGTTNWAGWFDANVNVDGDIYRNNSLLHSDIRYKTNIANIDSPLYKISQLQGIYYEWDTISYPDRNFYSGRKIGFIGQDMEFVLPEVVMIDDSGYYSITYERIIPVLVEAIKEQQQIIDSLSTIIISNPNLNSIYSRLDSIENCLANLPPGLGCDYSFKMGNNDDGSYQNSNLGIQDYIGINSEVVINPDNSLNIKNTTLYQNQPNPFRYSTKFSYTIGTPGNVELIITTYTGQYVTTLVNQYQNNGSYSIDWDTTDIAPGLYFYTLKVDGMEWVKKAIRIK